MDVMATPGPATDHAEGIESLVEAGARWFRIKMTHDPADIIQARLETIRAASTPERPLHAWMDISGDRPRISGQQETLHLQATQKVYILLGDPPEPKQPEEESPPPSPQESNLLPSTPTQTQPDHTAPTTEPTPNDEEPTLSEKRRRIYLRMDPKLFAHVQEGHRMTTADGRVSFSVLNVVSPSILLVQTQYAISPVRKNKGVNFPDTALSFEPLGDQDRAKLSALPPTLYDGIIVSFVRTPTCIPRARHELRTLLNHTLEHLAWVAKLETPDVTHNLNPILDTCDAVLIGRGDLAFEAGWTGMIHTQDAILETCKARGLWCCVGTGVLSSMIRNTIPTRSEVSDLARILDHGANAVMFAGETARGKHPQEAVRFARTFADNYTAAPPKRQACEE